MKGNEWRVLRAKERTCFNVLWTFVEACGPKLISICFIPFFFFWCVCYSMTILTGAESTWCYIGKEMEKQVARQRINFVAGHLVPTDDLSISLIFLYGDTILPLFVGKWKKNLGKGKGRKLFKLLVLGSMGWRFLFVWKSQMLIFFFLCLHFLGTQTKQVFILVIWNHVFFFSLILYLLKRHY